MRLGSAREGNGDACVLGVGGGCRGVEARTVASSDALCGRAAARVGNGDAGFLY